MIDFLLPPENERQSCLAGPADRDEWHHIRKHEGHIIDDDKMAQILNVPESYELVCYLPVGIAENDSVQPKKAFEKRGMV